MTYKRNKLKKIFIIFIIFLIIAVVAHFTDAIIEKKFHESGRVGPITRTTVQIYHELNRRCKLDGISVFEQTNNDYSKCMLNAKIRAELEFITKFDPDKNNGMKVDNEPQYFQDQIETNVIKAITDIDVHIITDFRNQLEDLLENEANSSDEHIENPFEIRYELMDPMYNFLGAMIHAYRTIRRTTAKIEIPIEIIQNAETILRSPHYTKNKEQTWIVQVFLSIEEYLIKHEYRNLFKKDMLTGLKPNEVWKVGVGRTDEKQPIIQFHKVLSKDCDPADVDWEDNKPQEPEKPSDPQSSKETQAEKQKSED